MSWWRRRKSQSESPAQDNPFVALRRIALDAFDQDLAAAGDSPVAVVVVDVPVDGGVACLVTMGGGTTSLYTSVGGGTIGAGSRAEVARASRMLLSVCADHLDLFVASRNGALPSGDVVRFHLFGSAGSLLADVPGDAFWGRVANPLLPVIAATQDLISAINST